MPLGPEEHLSVMHHVAFMQRDRASGRKVMAPVNRTGAVRTTTQRGCFSVCVCVSVRQRVCERTLRPTQCT